MRQACSIIRPAALIGAVIAGLCVQQPRAQPSSDTESAREAAPIDVTGYWAALVTEDWQYRMIVPARGDTSWLPLNQRGLAVAASWDPVADEAAGEACKAYAAPAIMRLPTRLRISWQNDNALELETDTGTQRRVFRFDQTEPVGEPTWQGHSVARWDTATGGDRQRRIFEDVSGSSPNAGALHVDTSHLRAGYLRKNGVPFSEQAFMTEYFNVLRGRDGERYLAVQTYVDDPVYLDRHYVRTYFFKPEPDGSNWNPTPCTADGWATD